MDASTSSDCNGSPQDLKNLWQCIESKNLPVPKMVFSIIGDSNNFVPKPWKKSVFQKALIDTAQSAGDSWLIFRGHKDGVSKIIHDAYIDYFKSKFLNRTGELSKHFDTSHVRIKLMRICMQTDPSHPNQNNQDQDYQDVVEFPPRNKSFLANFESFVSKQWGRFFNTSEDEKIEMRVPVMVVVVEGDLRTIKHAALSVKNNIPVLLVKGSGMAADLIVKFIEEYRSIKKSAPLLFGISFDNKKMKTLHRKLKDLAHNRHLLQIFDVNNDDPLILSKLVGEAIVRAWAMEESHEEKKKIITPSNETSKIKKTHAVATRVINPKKGSSYVKRFAKDERPHVLKTKYLSPASLPLYFYVGYQIIQKSRNRKEQSQILLFEALMSNRRDYVQILLEQGILLRMEDLPLLYRSTVNCENCHPNNCLHIPWILKQADEEAGKGICDEGQNSIGSDPKVVRCCCKGETESNRSESKAEHVVAMARSLVIKLLGYKENIKDKRRRKITQDDMPDKSTVPMHDLLLWSILANRPDLSEIIWSLSDDHLMTALLCAVLLKKLAKKTNNVQEQMLSKELTDHAKLFTKRSIRMSDELYQEDPLSAMKIVNTVTTIWNIKTKPLNFAHENLEIDFIGSTCPQRSLNRVWYNKLAPDLTPFLKEICRKPLKFVKAPIAWYGINYFFFLLMLIAFSAFVMTSVEDDFYERSIAKMWEYYTYIWAVGDFIEETIYGFGILYTGKLTCRGRLSRIKRYLYDFWKAVDLFSYLFLILALFVRHVVESHPYAIARRLFAVSLLIMYLRFLQLFLMNRRLGPTLIMIKEMFKDLLYFLVILFIFIVGTGTYYHANLYPNHVNLVGTGPWETWHIWKIFYYPYWQLYGEAYNEFLEVQDQPNCTNDRSLYETNSDIERCAEKDPTVPVVAAAYMLLSNLLLVNLVIAMFSYTFNSVMTNSEKLWRFERYIVINKYERKVPSPLNFIIRPIQFIRYAVKHCKRCKRDPKKEKQKNKRLQNLHIQKMIASRVPEFSDLG
ncbi:hypothetical protein FSP39_014255 [Pinctada imbricata]|uniref:Uncharacterized protein n=1 Tax=Pinctada imbricata TaxID=66713 RepID=A0AA89BTZ0_PINIB|nr:hypothetical protein FSP39_014255 [Pinctada imbricata]